MIYYDNDDKTSIGNNVENGNITTDNNAPRQYILYSEEGNYSDYRKDILGIYTSFDKGLIALLSVYGFIQGNHKYNYKTSTWTFNSPSLITNTNTGFYFKN